MAERPDFQEKQYAFAAHIRDPENVPPPANIEDRRMAIYRDLFFNNLLSLLSKTFPVLTKIHDRVLWRTLIRKFMVHHQAQTPYFLELPQEFVHFLQSDYPGKDEHYPFMPELAHYEWIELELSVSVAENDLDSIDAGGDMLAGVPVKSKLAYVLTYEYPVHNISKDFLPDSPGDQPTYLSVFRKADDELGFMELNPVTARLLQLIDENATLRNGGELLAELATELGNSDTAAVLAHGDDAMQQLRRAEILLGTLKPAEEPAN